VLEHVAAKRLPMLACHFPFLRLGHVGRGGKAYGWEAVIWS
jgi:hypothetical protein